MILEIRILVASAVVALVSIALVFFSWQLVFPAFVLAYLVYKLRYYGARVGVYEVDPDAVVSPGQWLPHAVLGVVGLFVLTRLVVFQLFDEVWATSTLEIPILVFADIPTLVGQLIPLGLAWGAIAGPPLVLSFAGGQLRQRFLPGVDSREAAVRASLWETLFRAPVYVLWAGLVTLEPVLRLWVAVPQVLGEAAGLAVGAGSGFAPLLGDVLFAVVAVGHAAPLAAIAAYYGIHASKYDDWTVPEVLGYRGLYPPSRTPTVGNVVVPVAAYLVYALPVLAFASGVEAAVPVLLLPVAVATLVGADVQGWTTRLSRSSPGRVPGVAGDGVVVGLALGLYAVAALAVVGLSFGVTAGTALTAFLVFPVVAVPFAYGANRLTGLRKSREVADLLDRVDADPSAELDEGQIDRMLAYVHARDDGLRATAIDGLAAAVGASSYRQSEAVEVFVSALDASADPGRDHPGLGRGRLAGYEVPASVEPLLERIETHPDEFARPALRGVATVLRDDPGAETRRRLLDATVVRRIDDYLDSEDPTTRARAAEAFARVVVAGYGTGSPPPLDELDALPVEAIETVVEDATDRDLTDAAVECFAVLWYHRDDLPVLTDADVQRLLVDLVDWMGQAGDDARTRAAFALTSHRAAVDADGLDRVLDRLESDDPVVRFVAAHVVRSSMAEHVHRIDPDELTPLLDDPDPAARWAGAAAVRAYVATARSEPRDLVAALVEHLGAVDPAVSGAAEATLLRTLVEVDVESLPDHARVARIAAASLRQGGLSVAPPAAELLAAVLVAHPGDRREDGVASAVEAGLTHDLAAVRAASVRAAAAVVAADPADGRPFVEGLVANLGAQAPVGGIAVSCLERVLDAYPAYGTEVIADLGNGLTNQSTIDDQYAGSMVVGRTVADVTASLVADVTDHGVRGGEPLVDPLVDLAGVASGSTREAIFAALANLSEEYPDAARRAVPVATTALDEGSARVRRDAGRVLANVAANDPAAVRQVVDSLVVAVDDADPQTRAMALGALDVVATNDPGAVADGVRRVIGRLDDDSSIVREGAAEVVMTLAEQQPGLIQPAAEASDRLRRLQRDPAVDIDGESLQAAATAAQTGSPIGESEEVADDDTAIWTPESPDEVGSSGDTRVFDPTAGDGDDRLPEGTCPTCGADLSDADDPDACPECGAGLP